MSKDVSKFGCENLVLTRKQVRRVDQIAMEHFGMPGILLMENAGRGCFEQLVKRSDGGPVVICCGPGNNGGDGFVVARHLDNAGIDTKVLLTGDPDKFLGDAKTNLSIIEQMNIPILSLSGLAPEFWLPELEVVDDLPTEWIIDSILGTGAYGAPRPPIGKLIELANSVSANRLAIDVPTGLDCDTGVCRHPTFCADVTCTFVAMKPAFVIQRPPMQIGMIEVIDIGVPMTVIRQAGNEG